MAVSRLNPASVFQKVGLRTRGAWRPGPVASRYQGLPPAARIRDALEELGGLYAAFAQFLCWRADLLPSDYLGSLRQVRWQAPPIPRNAVERTLTSELGEKGKLLGQGLEPEPCWSSLSRCAYRTQHEGRRVVVQLMRYTIPDAAFAGFERGLRQLEEEGTERATAPEVLDQFRQWMRLADSSARERSYLEALVKVREQTLVEYPLLIPELSTENVLCWPWVEGQPVSSLIAEGSAEAVEKVAEGVLEQICILSVVDGELDLEAMVLTSGGRLAVRRAHRLIPVPAALVRTVLKYVSAVLGGNTPLAAHLLLKLGRGRFPLELETRLLDELSGLEPDLKVNLRFPQTATVLESNWRAFSRMQTERPLFLDCMHRNLIAVGYWNAETAGPSLAPADSIAEAQWRVLGRLLRTRMGELFSRDVASEWFVGSGLLFFEALRQLGRLTDGFRDNDLSVGLDTGGTEDGSQKANRTIRLGVVSGMLLVVFLLCLRWAPSLPQPFSAALGALAVLAAAGLFWNVSRLG